MGNSMLAWVSLLAAFPTPATLYCQARKTWLVSHQAFCGTCAAAPARDLPPARRTADTPL